MAPTLPPPPGLPLLGATPDVWAVRVLTDPLALLDDHAHLEKKAAANALELVPRRGGARACGPAPGPAHALGTH